MPAGLKGPPYSDGRRRIRRAGGTKITKRKTQRKSILVFFSSCTSCSLCDLRGYPSSRAEALARRRLGPPMPAGLKGPPYSESHLL
jgi:hypothetical protein